MLIRHPLLGPRDAQEFTVLGDAAQLARPDGMADGAEAAFCDHVYLRDNPAGLHRELWYHEHGDRSLLIVTRDTLSHAVIAVELASELASELAAGPGAEPGAEPGGEPGAEPGAGTESRPEAGA